MATASGIYKGTVVRVAGNQVWVRIPRIARDHDFGPLETVRMPRPVGTLDTGPGGTPMSEIPLAGDRVLVSYVNGGTAHHDELVVIGVLA